MEASVWKDEEEEGERTFLKCLKLNFIVSPFFPMKQRSFSTKKKTTNSQFHQR